MVIDERSGIIVMGENVRISRSPLPRATSPSGSPRRRRCRSPSRWPNGRTADVPRTNIQVDTQSGNGWWPLEPGVTLQELVDGLNALGVGPRDLISILQAIKAAGALQAEIEVM